MVSPLDASTKVQYLCVIRVSRSGWQLRLLLSGDASCLARTPHTYTYSDECPTGSNNKQQQTAQQQQPITEADDGSGGKGQEAPFREALVARASSYPAATKTAIGTPDGDVSSRDDVLRSGAMRTRT